MPGASMNNDASIKYWNEVWLDELIDEAFRLIKEKASINEGASAHRKKSSYEEVAPSTMKL